MIKFIHFFLFLLIKNIIIAIERYYCFFWNSGDFQSICTKKTVNLNCMITMQILSIALLDIS